MCGSSCRIDKRLLPMKASYFFTLAGTSFPMTTRLQGESRLQIAVASLLPYIAVYMKQLGLSPSESALIYGTVPFLGAIVRPIIGAVADKLHAHKIVLSFCCVLCGAAHGCLVMVPPVIQPSDQPSISTLTINCEADSSTIQYCVDTHTTLGTGCKVPANALLNLSAAAQDPFFRNASDCTLQCDLSLVQEEDSGLCFANMMGIKNQEPVCGDEIFRDSDVENASKPQIEFIMEEMNHSLTRYHFLPEGGQSMVCHYYFMSAFLYNGSSYRKLYCAKSTPLDCQVECTRFSERAIRTDCEPKATESKRYGQTFWIFFGLFMGGQFLFSPVFSLIDAMAYDFLGDERGKWGKQRLWGTIGFALAGIVAGLAMDNFQFTGKREDIDYTPSFIAFAVLLTLTSVVVCKFKLSSQLSSSQVCSNVGSLCRNIEVLALFFVVFVFGMLTGVIETFLFWHLQSLGASQLLLGLCMFMNCLPEVPILFLSGKIIKKIGQIRCLYITAFAYAIRFLAYSFLLNPWMVLGIEPLHGITFGLMYAAASSYGSVLTPAGLHGTMQGLIGGLHFGFGKGLGALLGGYAFETYGAVTLFRSCSVASVILVVIYAMLHLCFSLRGDKSTPSSSKGEDDDDFEEKDPPEAEKMLSSHIHRNHKPRPNNYKEAPVPIEVEPPALPTLMDDNRTLNTFKGYNTHPPVYGTGADMPLVNKTGSLGRESARESAV